MAATKTIIERLKEYLDDNEGDFTYKELAEKINAKSINKTHIDRLCVFARNFTYDERIVKGTFSLGGAKKKNPMVGKGGVLTLPKWLMAQTELTHKDRVSMKINKNGSITLTKTNSEDYKED